MSAKITTETEATLQGELDHALAQLRRLERRQQDATTGRSLDLASDLFDNAQAVESREQSHLSVVRLTERVRRLRTALDRLRKGDYGTCEECGEAIPPARLRAIPGVSTCVRCQEQLEQGA
jgi:DnaK suppressor protein